MMYRNRLPEVELNCRYGNDERQVYFYTLWLDNFVLKHGITTVGKVTGEFESIKLRRREPDTNFNGSYSLFGCALG